ncbi:hypothetical protein GF354_05285 [Candidatus Peregrinibacteria bacterium]|nr:hypothetical protein [Candidatus Peregrinibacteria bacterium]
MEAINSNNENTPEDNMKKALQMIKEGMFKEVLNNLLDFSSGDKQLAERLFIEAVHTEAGKEDPNNFIRLMGLAICDYSTEVLISLLMKPNRFEKVGDFVLNTLAEDQKSGLYKKLLLNR